MLLRSSAASTFLRVIVVLPFAAELKAVIWPPPMHERNLAILLFVGAAVLAWIGFVMFVAQPETEIWLQIGVGVAGVTAATAVSAWLAPTLAAEARAGAKMWKGALLGACVTLASYALAAVLLGVGTTLVTIAVEPNYTVRRAGEGALLMVYMSFVGAITLLSPGFLLGGAAGAVFYRIIRTQEAPAI